MLLKRIMCLEKNLKNKHWENDIFSGIRDLLVTYYRKISQFVFLGLNSGEDSSMQKFGVIHATFFCLPPFLPSFLPSFRFFYFSFNLSDYLSFFYLLAFFCSSSLRFHSLFVFLPVRSSI